MKTALLAFVILFFPVIVFAENFYGIPIHPKATQKEISDSKNAAVATMRYIADVKPNDMISFYKTQLPSSVKQNDLGDTFMLTYNDSGLSKMVSILDFFGKADVTLQSEK